MGRKRTAGQAVVFAILTLLPAQSARAEVSDPLRYFASCTGRLSAQMEHEWLLSDPRADETEAQRAILIDLLRATMLPDQGHQVLNWRIEAKAAQAALLTRATFRDDDWAKDQAARFVRNCTSLLMS
ncbi:MAG: hypothetical protein AAGL89_00720 [Pseudomonadota bacterium]